MAEALVPEISYRFLKAGDPLSGPVPGGEHKLADWVELSIHLQLYGSLERTSFVTHAAHGTELSQFMRAALPSWLAARAAEVYNQRRNAFGRPLDGVAPEDVTGCSIILRRGHTYLAPGFRFLLRDTEVFAELLDLPPAEATKLATDLSGEEGRAKKAAGSE